MKGDFTRFTFDPRKHYSAVLMQQGRVQVDADWNEQLAIEARRDRQEGADVIGGCGVPTSGGGFQVLPLGPGVEDFGISAGRIYVDGIGCELVSSAEPVLGFPAADSVKVGSTTLDGMALASGDWVQVSAVNRLQPVLAQVSGVDAINGIITLDRDIVDFDSIRAILDSQNRLNVFVIGSDGAVWRNFQTTPTGGWGTWTTMGGIVDMLAVAKNADGRLEIFGRGLDGAVWHNWEATPGGAWSGWSWMGGWVDRLTVGRNQDGRLELFVRGGDQSVYHNWQTAPNNGWSGWVGMGGWIDELAVASNADGRIEVFARGADRGLWHISQTAPNDGWSGWASLGGWIDRLTVGQNGDGRLEVFARGADQAVWHKWQTATGANPNWSGWQSLGGVVDIVTVGRNQDGRLELFVRGTDRAVYHNSQAASGWSGWSALGGWVDMLYPSADQDGSLDIFARGADQNLYRIRQLGPNNGWGTWAGMQQPVANLAKPSLSRLTTYTTQPEFPAAPSLGGQTGTGVSGIPGVMPATTGLDVYVRATAQHLIYLHLDQNSPVAQVIDVTATAAGAPIAPNCDPYPISYGGGTHVLAAGASGQLLEYVLASSGNWTFHDRTSLMQGKSIASLFSAAVKGTDVFAFCRGSAGELLLFHSTTAGAWDNVTDIVPTSIPAGAPLSFDPTAVMLGTDLHVFAIGAQGQLLEYKLPNAPAGSWTFTDHSNDPALTGNSYQGRPAARIDGGAPHLYLRDTGGDFWELHVDGSGIWQAVDHSTEVGGATLAGDPAVLSDNVGVHVYARSTSGDLLEFLQAASQTAWQLIDRSAQLGASPLAGDPAAVATTTEIHVFAGAADGRLEEFRKLADPSPWQLLYHTADVPFSRTDLVYLDVWERHVTAIEDPEIRESALRGPDHATRLQLEAQVKVLKDVGQVGCNDSLTGWPPAPSGGLLSTLPVQAVAADDPCLLGPGLGYDGLENRLYRVEVHAPGDMGKATFKWSRDNGSVVFAIDEFVSGHGQRVRLSRLGRDQTLTLHVNDWVEVLNDDSELDGTAGTLASVTAIDQAQRLVTLSKDVSAYAGGGHPRLRRWDQSRDAVEIDAAVKTLESNIQIQFGGGGFKTGDYWVFAARTSTRDVEVLSSALPRGVQHHYCKLGLVKWSASGGQLQSSVTDCRVKFPPLTGITAGDVGVTDTCGLGVSTLQDVFNEQCNQRLLRYVSGDGQEGQVGAALPVPLVVGVEDGFGRPVAGATVTFTVHGGSVSATSVSTDSHGMATTIWTLGTVSGLNQVAAQLNPAHLPVIFSALGSPVGAAIAFNVLRYVGGDGQEGVPGQTLPCPLIAGVEDAQGHPVPGIQIQFKAAFDNDVVTEVNRPANSGHVIDVVTDRDGLAEVHWTFASRPFVSGCHRVDAYFASEAGVTPAPHLGVKFEAAAVVGTSATLPRVAALSWANDGVVTAAAFAKGLAVDFTDAMDAQSANPSTFIVQIDLAEAASDANGAVAGHRPFVLPGTIAVEADSAGQSAHRFRFTPSQQVAAATTQWLNREKSVFPNESPLRVRCRVRLIGSSIINQKGTQRLNGTVLGPTFGPTSGLPAGNGVEGSDFESWFWFQ